MKFTKRSWRFILLFTLLLVIVAIGAIFRRMGLGEIALVAAFLGLVLVLESGRYVLRQFIKGYRGENKARE